MGSSRFFRVIDVRKNGKRQPEPEDAKVAEPEITSNEKHKTW